MFPRSGLIRPRVEGVRRRGPDMVASAIVGSCGSSGRERDLVDIQHRRAHGKARHAGARPVVAVQQPAPDAHGQHQRDPLLDLADPLLDLVGEEETRARTSAACSASTATRSVIRSFRAGSLRIPAVRYAAVRKPGTNRPETRILKPWRWK